MGLTFLYDPWGLQRKRGMSDAHGFDKKVSNPWVLAPGEPVAPLGPGSQSVNDPYDAPITSSLTSSKIPLSQLYPDVIVGLRA